MKSSMTSAERMAEADRLQAFCRNVFLAIGCDDITARDATRAMMHASLLGVDSHGVRLLGHYVKAMEGGRVNPRPDMRISPGAGAVAALDADHGHGAPASYRAMQEAVRLAGQHGLAMVGIRNSSHFGAAGAYARAAAEAGMIGLAVCNSDSFVRLHDGAQRFHGTNPIACAVPSGEERPWLLDMATSAVPFNRVKLYRSLGWTLPEGVASDADGVDTTDPHAVEMLAPLGGQFGFKGAGLGGLVEIFSAVFTGMRLSFEILPMGGPDFATPRELGAMVMAVRPDALISREAFEAGMRRYLEALRQSPARPGAEVMAPGDREWRVEARRRREGVPIDPETEADFRALAERFDLALPFEVSGARKD